jgi:hypothetical protein
LTDPHVRTHDDDGNLEHAREADGLGHERLTRPRCRGHGPHAGECGTEHHIDCGEFVFGLNRDAAKARQLARHPLENIGGGRYRIPRHEPAAGDERAVRDCIIPGHQ